MVYCNMCGTENPEGSQFCNQCGHQLAQGAESNLDRRFREFGEEVGKIGQTIGTEIGRKSTDATTDFDKAFGLVGPLIKAVIGFVVLVIITQLLNIIGDSNDLVEEVVQRLLLPYLVLYLVLFIFFAYSGYLSRKKVLGYQYLEPLVQATAISLALFVLLKLFGIIGQLYSINALITLSDAMWVILPLVFLLVLLIGYSLVVTRQQAMRSSVTPQAMPLGQTQNFPPPTSNMPKRLFRSGRDKMLGGVLGGLGEFFDIDPVIMRIIWILLTLVSFGTFLLVYLILWVIVPRNPLHQW